MWLLQTVPIWKTCVLGVGEDGHMPRYLLSLPPSSFLSPPVQNTFPVGFSEYPPWSLFRAHRTVYIPSCFSGHCYSCLFLLTGIAGALSHGLIRCLTPHYILTHKISPSNPEEILKSEHRYLCKIFTNRISKIVVPLTNIGDYICAWVDNHPWVFVPVRTP